MQSILSRLTGYVNEGHGGEGREGRGERERGEGRGERGGEGRGGEQRMRHKEIFLFYFQLHMNWWVCGRVDAQIST